jgi:SAM-dependent methyltransferase
MGKFNQNSYDGKNQLLDSEIGLLNYRKWITKKIIRNSKKYSKNTIEQILEFGAGTGSLSEIYFTETGIKPICYEIDSELRTLILKKELTVRVSINEIRDNNEFFDLIFTSNVLEHIEDDITALIEIKSILKKEGLIIIYVPAHQWLFSGLDLEVGHFRRYSKRNLQDIVRQANFSIVKIEYADSLGILASIVIKLFGYKNKFNLGGKTSMRIYDYIFHPISKLIDFITLRKVLGNNLFVVAKNIKN